jgi:hypothetical protein
MQGRRDHKRILNAMRKRRKLSIPQND